MLRQYQALSYRPGVLGVLLALALVAIACRAASAQLEQPATPGSTGFPSEAAILEATFGQVRQDGDGRFLFLPAEADFIALAELGLWSHAEAQERAAGDGEPWSASVTQVIEFRHRSEAWAVAIIQVDGPSSGCHACSGVAGLAVFHQAEGRWLAGPVTRYALVIGSWGVVPSEARVVEWGADRWGILFEYWDGGQGYSYGSYTLAAYFSGGWRVIGDFEAGFDDSGATLDESVVTLYEGTVEFVADRRGDFNEIAVTYAGTTKGVPMRKVRRLVYWAQTQRYEEPQY